jgi:hypothetical protein
MRLYVILLALAITAIAFTAPALAGTCTISGVVVDAVGSPVQGATVTLFDGNRADVMTIDTGADGEFSFVNVQVGTNECTVRVFYNDRRQTYTNPSYFNQWYPATGEQIIDKNYTTLETYRKPTSSTTSLIPSALAPSGLTLPATALAFMLAVIVLLSMGPKKSR